MTLLEAVRKQDPKLMSNGQVKITCVFTDLHSRDSLTRQQLYLTPDINAYHCFSCRSKGKLTSLLTEVFDVPYFEALDMVHIQEYKKEKRSDIETDDYLWDLVPPNEFINRGFSEELLLKFRIGTTENNKGQKVTVVPCYTPDKSTLKGIKYRVDKPTRQFWYSPLFNKEEYLYKNHLSYDYCIVTEGETDVLRSTQFNTNATGLLGVSMSEWQENDLRKYKKLYLGLDADLAGVRGMNEIYKRLYKDVDIEFLCFPNKDLGNVVSGRQLKQILSEAYNYAEFKYLTGI